MGILKKVSSNYSIYDLDFPDPDREPRKRNTLLKCLVVGLAIILVFVGLMYWINNF